MPRSSTKPSRNGHTISPFGGLMDPITANKMEQLTQNLTTARAQLTRTLMDPRRDIDDECGYPRSETGQGIGSINPDLFRNLYERECIATRVVQVLPKECWQVTPTIYEDADSEETTPFEEAWDALEVNMAGMKSWHQDEEGGTIWDLLLRADILSGIGHFGILLLGIDDGKNLQDPVDAVVIPGTRGKGDSQPTKNELQRMQDMVANPRMVRNVDGKEQSYQLEYLNSWEVSEPARFEQYVRARKGFVYNGKAIFLDEDEALEFKKVLTTNNREAGLVEELTYNDAWGQGEIGGSYQATPGTDQQYAGTFPAAPAALAGTDQQYFGVQFGPSEMMGDKPAKGHKLVFMRAFDESLVQIVRYEWNVNNPRFGMPVMYRVTLNDPRETHSGVGLPMATVFVHWSRVIHLADNLGSSEIFGVPRMRPVLNRLLDLRKLYSGSAEMYWRGAFHGINLATHPQLGGDVEVDTEGMRDQMEQYFNGLQRYLLTTGMSANTLAPTVVDPTPQITVQIEAICIQIGVPIRVFKGSERGELASNQDDASWNDRLKHRQLMYLCPRLLVPLIDRLIILGVLPEPGKSGKQKVNDLTKNGWTVSGRAGSSWIVTNEDGDTKEVSVKGYTIEWPDLDSNTKKDKAMIALQLTQALAAFVSGGVENLMPPMAYLVNICGFDEEEAEAILEQAAAHLEDVHPEEEPDSLVPGHGPAETPEQDQQDAMDQQQQAIKKGIVADPNKPQPMQPQKLGPGQQLVHGGTGQMLAKGPPPAKPAGPAKKPPSANAAQDQLIEHLRNLRAKVFDMEHVANARKEQELSPGEAGEIILASLLEKQ